MIYECHSINKEIFLRKGKYFFCFQNLIPEISTLHGLEWANGKKNFEITKIFVLRQNPAKWQQIKLSYRTSNIWWLRSTNHVKFIKECVLYTVKHGFVGVQGVEIHQLSGKEIVLGTLFASLKMIQLLTVFPIDNLFGKIRLIY